MDHQRPCKIEGCAERYYGKGYCEPHYRQYRPAELAALQCKAPVCTFRRFKKGYCSVHWQQWRKDGVVVPLYYPKVAR